MASAVSPLRCNQIHINRPKGKTKRGAHSFPATVCAAFGALKVAYGCRDSLGLLVQQVEECGGLLADQVDAAGVVDVVDVVPADALGPVLLLHMRKRKRNALSQSCKTDKSIQTLV